MAGDIKNKYGTSNQTITVTLASLTNTSLRQSAVIDNSSNVHPNAGVMAKIKTGASGTSSTGYIQVYAYGTADGGTTYSGGASGSDAAYTADKANLAFLGRVAVAANATTYYGGPWSVRSAFGDCMPEKWGLVFENLSGGTLDSTGGNHAVFYQGELGQYT